MRARAAALLALLLVLLPAPALGARRAGRASHLRRAPSAPPLAAGAGLGTEMSGAEEASASAPTSGGEPLASNGLRSPLCRAASEADLPASAARDCRATGFEAAQAPNGDYAFDVHIDAGLSHPGNYGAVVFQDVAQLVWGSLVAVVHGLIVLLDWCFTLDLLNGPAMGGVARALPPTQSAFTQPWLAAMLAIAAMLALYNGLIRRRVAQTLGEALLMIAMMAGGLWVIVDPIGTVGALGAWANEASLGTLGAVSAGTPAHPRRTLAESDQYVFGAAIDGPWCYLEFGDVSWCESAARLDPRLRIAALQIAAKGDAYAPGPSAALLRAARTNGELFLALPANGPARNSINEQWSLYHALCDRSEGLFSSGGSCRGRTAPEAEFRTQSGTGARVIGTAFIAAGLLGMILVLGSIALRLLYAAIVSLVCLLLTPAAVLAPTLGEGGRRVFRAWATRLLGAVCSKVVFAFLLGAVLQSERALATVRLGWLTQWVLLSATWWIGFLNRHKLADLARGGGEARHHSIARRARDALDTPRTALRHAGEVRRRLQRPAPNVAQRRRLARAGHERAEELAEAQVARSLQSELGQARALLGAEPEMRSSIAAKSGRLQRIRAAHAAALSGAGTSGDAREERSRRQRAIRLGERMEQLRREIDTGQGALLAARRTVRDAELAKRASGKPFTRDRAARRARLLDDQAALPRRQRDYAALAGIAGLGRSEYEALAVPAQREARLEIDRELALRRALPEAAADVAANAGADSPGWRQRREADKHVNRRADELLHAEGHRRLGALAGQSRLDAWKREGAAAVRVRGGGSPVLDDAREVAARRKRQLGGDRR